MNLNQQLTDELQKHAGTTPGTPCSIHLGQSGDTEVHVQADVVEKMGCSVPSVEMTVPKLAGAGVEDLKDWANTISGKVNYLMEPLRLLEFDADMPAGVLRSDKPQQLPDEVRYYEVELSADQEAGHLSMHRYSGKPGEDREPVGMAFTHEMLGKLINDLDSSIPSKPKVG